MRPKKRLGHSMENTMKYRGIILKESLLEEVFPEELKPFVELTYPYMLDGIHPMTVYRLGVPEDKVNWLAWLLAGKLKPELYFAQISSADTIMVVFPHTLVKVQRELPLTSTIARTIGKCFGIQAHQMKFEEMFDKDHPNMP